MVNWGTEYEKLPLFDGCGIDDQLFGFEEPNFNGLYKFKCGCV